MGVWVDGSPRLSGVGNHEFWIVCGFSADLRNSLTYSRAWSELSSVNTLSAAEFSGCSCFASCGDRIVNFAEVGFFLSVNGAGEVLVTRTSILEFRTVEIELALAIWLSPEYCSVGWIMPVVLVRVRRLIPASIVTHGSGMMVS